MVFSFGLVSPEWASQVQDSLEVAGFGFGGLRIAVVGLGFANSS